MTDTNSQSQQMWGGRFAEAPDELIASFTASVALDKELAIYDIQGSIAHAKMLGRQQIITTAEADKIIEGLDILKQTILNGEFVWQDSLEDVHMNIEAALVCLIGDTGKKLHTGRSRNDQVATDMRLYLRDKVDNILNLITKLQTELVTLATQQADTIMPGFTHLQVAQPVTFGHHMLAWNEMLERDYQRLTEVRKRINISPLGCAALAGTSYPLDREYTAELLGFDSCATNSLDAVSDRDFLIEFLAAASLTMTHLSRWSEELILWSNPQFNFISLPDSVCTGSSIMPQKKNPDVPELVRGKTGVVLGNLMAMLNIMKAQPLAYNRDNQEDKQPMFASVHTLTQCLQVYSVIITGIQVNQAATEASCKLGFINATDLADYLVVKGIAFRDAHEITGKLVALAITNNYALEDIPLNVMQEYASCIDKDIFAALDLKNIVAKRKHIGGTATHQVLQAAATAQDNLQARKV